MITHARRRSIRSTSSGVYVLPGSIGSPLALVDGRPDGDVRARTVKVHVGVQSSWEKAIRIESEAVVLKISAQRDVPAERIGQSGKSCVAFEAVATDDSDIAKRRACGRTELQPARDEPAERRHHGIVEQRLPEGLGEPDAAI